MTRKSPPDIPIVILAAGQSRRMRGADKLMQAVDGQPLLRRQAALARAATAAAVLVAVPPAPHARHDALRGLDVTPVPVPDAAEGMNASLRAAIKALPADAPAAMVMLADLPDLTPDDLRAVLASVDLASGKLIWRGATADGSPGHPIVFAAALFNRLARLAGDSGGREVVSQLPGETVLVPLPGRRARRDLDTPEDWAAWRSERGEAGT